MAVSPARGWGRVGETFDDRVTEFVDHLHEHFVDPCVVQNGHYVIPTDDAGAGGES